jgi:hypothetical protein
MPSSVGIGKRFALFQCYHVTKHSATLSRKRVMSHSEMIAHVVPHGRGEK